MKMRNQFATACLTIGLTSAWTPFNATADTFQVDATPLENLSHVYFLYGANQSSYYYYATATPMPDLTAGMLNSVQVTAARPSANGHPVFSIIGLYDNANLSVTMALNDSTATSLIGGSVTFDTAFADTGYTESNIASALILGDTTTLASFFSTSVPKDFNSRTSVAQDDAISLSSASGTLVDFSGASLGGTIALVVPEPAALTLLGWGLAGVWCYERRRRNQSSPN